MVQKVLHRLSGTITATSGAIPTENDTMVSKVLLKFGEKEKTQMFIYSG